MKAKILLVEDERDIKDLMLLHLKREGFEATAVENGEEALKLLTENEYNLAILDWMLPGVSGLEICKIIQKSKAGLPVLMVTARADTTDIVLGLEVGADDYVTKPFEIQIFLARVRALLRRSSAMRNENPKRFQIAELLIDADSHQVTCAGEEIQLTTSEFKMLIALAQNQGRVLSREKLIALVQGEGVAVIDRTVDTHVFGLRKKLGACADVIETIRGVGYRVRA